MSARRGPAPPMPPPTSQRNGRETEAPIAKPTLPPPPTAELTLSDVAEENRAALDAYCTVYREMSAQESAAKADKERLMKGAKAKDGSGAVDGGELGALLRGIGAKTILGSGWRVAWTRGKTTKTIDPRRLLALGVSMATIEAATVKDEAPGYYKVLGAKEED